MRIALWTRTAESAGFPYTSMPAYTVLPMVPCLFYMRLWTLGLAFFCTLFVWRMTVKGRTLTWMFNRLRGRLHGNRLSARPVWVIRRFCTLFDFTRE